jgi:hypothetical protein
MTKAAEEANKLDFKSNRNAVRGKDVPAVRGAS